MRQKFKDIREKQGKSQAEFAVAAGVSPSTVSGFESDRVPDLSPRIRRILADAYGVDISEIDEVCREKESVPAA